MSEVKRYQVIGYLVEGKTLGRINVVTLADYDALAAQRDEGLAREAELRRSVQALRGGSARADIYFRIAESLLREPEYERTPGDFEYEHPIHDQIIALQQRLAEAEKLIPHYLKLSDEMRAAGEHARSRAIEDQCYSKHVLEAVFFEAAIQVWIDQWQEALANPGGADGEKL